MADTRRDRRKQNRNHRSGIVLGIAAAIVAFLLVYQVFLKGDDTPAASTVAPTPAAAVSETSTTTVAPLEPELPNGSFDEFSVRDPFEPVTGVPTTGTTSTTTTTTTPGGTVATTPTTTPAQNPGGTNEVALLDVYDNAGVQTARVRVGTSEYTVTAGQAFAGNYQLVVFTNATCANFTYADSPFSLCTGEQVIK